MLGGDRLYGRSVDFLGRILASSQKPWRVWSGCLPREDAMCLYTSITGFMSSSFRVNQWPSSMSAMTGLSDDHSIREC